MKKYIIFTLCIINMYGMEKSIIKREAREWNAKDYDEANIKQKPSFQKFLKKSNITTENRTILSVGCGTGKIEHKLAQKALEVHGFDASKNMIEYAQNTYKRKNLSFEHCFAEDFIPKKFYDLAIAAFSIHWIEDRKEAFKRINNSLKMNGELFALMPTTDNSKPNSLIVALEMIQLLKNSSSHADKKLINITDQTTQDVIIGCSYPSHKELIDMLQKTGFEILRNEEHFFTCIMSEDDITKTHWAIFSSRPFIKQLSNEIMQNLFQEFITRYKEKLTKTDDGKFSDKTYTTLIHARKIKDTTEYEK